MLQQWVKVACLRRFIGPPSLWAGNAPAFDQLLFLFVGPARLRAESRAKLGLRACRCGHHPSRLQIRGPISAGRAPDAAAVSESDPVTEAAGRAVFPPPLRSAASAGEAPPKKASLQCLGSRLPQALRTTSADRISHAVGGNADE